MRHGIMAALALGLSGGTGPISHTRTTAEGGGLPMSEAMRDEKRRERLARKADAMARAEAKRERRRRKHGPAA